MRLKNFHSGSFLTLQPTFATDPIFLFMLKSWDVKKGTAHAVPFLRFPIGTISKVKKDCLGLRYKGTGVVPLCQISGYVIKHVYSACYCGNLPFCRIIYCSLISYLYLNCFGRVLCVNVKKCLFINSRWHFAPNVAPDRRNGRM